MRRWVPRPVDLVVAGLLTGGTQAEVWAGLIGGAPRPLLAFSYALGTAAAAWHRVAPITAMTISLSGLVVIPSLMGVDPAAGLMWLVTALAVMASAGYHARRPLAALAVSFGLLGLSIVAHKGLVIADIAYAWLLAGGCWIAGRALAQRTLRAGLSEQRAAYAEQEAQWRAAAAVVDERLRIARELHDVIAHDISVMTLHVGGIRRLLRPDQVEERAILEGVEATGREVLDEMHRLLGVLRDSESADAAPAPGLSAMAGLLGAARTAGVEPTLTVTGAVRLLPPGLDLAAYRIVQEAVTNVLRHSAARRVAISLDYGPRAIELRVVDDGTGGVDHSSPGHGHAGIRERAALYGGTVSIGPQPGGGYAVHAVLPAPESAVTEAPR